MTDESAPHPESPRELLASVRHLTRQVRLAQRDTWFPLLVFAVITLAAIPLNAFGPHHTGPCRYGSTHGLAMAACWNLAPWSMVYWPAALVAAYAAIAGFSLYRSARRGVATRIRPYVIVGVVVAVLATAASVWQKHYPPTSFSPDSFPLAVSRLAAPAAAIGLALLVLAWVERNRALAGFSLAYLAIVLVPGELLPVNLDRVAPGSLWYVQPRLLVLAAMLLAGSLGFAVFRPHLQRSGR